MNQDVVSFMLRFVREASEDQQARWRGVIQHVQGNAERQFTQFSEALTFMQTHVNEMVKGTFDGESQPETFNPVLETARLWGEFVPQYNKMMLNAVEEAVQSSMKAPQQMEQTITSMMRAWGMTAGEDPAQSQVEALKEQVASLTQQIDTLQAKLAETESKPRRRTKKTTE